jgi:hypothetical protein
VKQELTESGADSSGRRQGHVVIAGGSERGSGQGNAADERNRG